MIMVDFAWEQATIGSINSSNAPRESSCLNSCLPRNDKSASCRSHTSFVQELLLGAEASTCNLPLMQIFSTAANT